MIAKLAFAHLDWIDGVPKAAGFGDVYYSKDNGLQESRHVFLAGNRLSERLIAHKGPVPFCIGETGFGTGLNFLCLWQFWRSLAKPRPQLHFVSLEGFPLSPASLRKAHGAFGDIAEPAALLRDVYPAPVPGVHRRVFEDGALILDLHFGPADRVLSWLVAEIDCWFLDGFAPAKNPGLWGPEVLAKIAALTKPGGTFATFTAVGQVKRDLIRAGFKVVKRPGFGRKREMLTGTKTDPAAAIQTSLPYYAASGRQRYHDVIVLGAGMAGTCLAHALKQAGAAPLLVERLPRAGAGASGNPAGLIKPFLQAELSPPARFFAACYSYAQQFYRDLGDAVAFEPTGAVDLPADDADAERFDRIAGLWPESWVRPVSAQAASGLFGQTLPRGGLYYPGAGALSPSRLCRHLARGVDARYGQEYRITRTQGLWRLQTGQGDMCSAPALVLANGLDVSLLACTRWLADILHPVRGQISRIRSSQTIGAVRVPVHEAGYLLPARDGGHVIGATFQPGDHDLGPRAADDLENKSLLSSVIPALAQGTVIDNRAGLRVKTRDHLPVLGAVPDLAAFKRCFENRCRSSRFGAGAWQVPGLYVFTALGARGLLISPLAAQYLAAVITGGAVPLPTAAIAAVTPGRFPFRALRRDHWPEAWG